MSVKNSSTQTLVCLDDIDMVIDFFKTQNIFIGSEVLTSPNDTIIRIFR